MPAEVEGARPIREWLSLLDDRQSAFYRKLAEIYGRGGDLIAAPARLCRRAVEAFGAAYGQEQSAIIVRSTGRINLMGMHVDHRGGAVNPIAIKEVFFVAAPRDDDQVALRNVQADEFPAERFRIRDCLPPRKIENWDAWCHDEFEPRRSDPAITWSNYARAAVLYLQHLNTKADGAFAPALRGMNVMVAGNIPRAAGLSTSSSIVVAAAEACIRLSGLQVSPLEFIDICGYGEWYVGTRGGSGDHAAIKFGRANAIVHLTSFPLTVTAAPFPRGYKIVLANSLVEAKKRAGARDAFNSRVASYVFGLLLVRRNYPRHAAQLEHLRDLNPETLGVDEAEVYRLLKSLPEAAGRRQVLELLAGQEEEVRHVFRSHAEPPEGYKLRQVCLYGVAECLRAKLAPARLEAGDLAGFGELINISHDGDRVTKTVNGKREPTDNSYPDKKIEALIAALQSDDPARQERARLWRQPGGYDVSVPELDLLTDIALATRGVVGAGLVGAGLGGSIVAIVEENSAPALIDNLEREYYRPRQLPVQAEIVTPVGGAGVLEV